MSVRATDIDTKAEAEVCKRRGHQPSNVLKSEHLPNVCKWCRKHYDKTQSETIDYLNRSE
jgi:hypothetical protein